MMREDWQSRSSRILEAYAKCSKTGSSKSWARSLSHFVNVSPIFIIRNAALLMKCGPQKDQFRYDLTIRNVNPPSAAFMFLPNLLHLHSARKLLWAPWKAQWAASPQSSRTLQAIPTRSAHEARSTKVPAAAKPDSFLVLTARLKPS